LATVTGGAGKDFIHRLDDGRVVPAGFADVTGVTTGDDVIAGLGGDDIIYGDDGNDVIDGGAGADTMTGGAGNDIYYVDNIFDAVIEANNGGIDQVFSSVSYSLKGTYVERLTLTGSADIDAVGNSLAATLIGNSGNNRLEGGKSYGRAGNDTYYVDQTGDTAREDWTAGIDDGGVDLVVSSANYTLSAFIENLTLTGDHATYGIGNSLDNVIVGTDANNTLDGRAGADTMIGGAGVDGYYVDDAGDMVVEAAGGGNDTVMTSSLNYTLGAEVENLSLLGSLDLDGTGNTLANDIRGNTGNNILTGGDGNDILNGGEGNDTLDGGAGNDDLDGGFGEDRMTGGAGDDTYHVQNAGDVVIEANHGGTDQVLSSISYSLAGQYVEMLTLTGSANLSATGNSLANTLTGNSGNNMLDGGAGADTLDGRSGADLMAGGAGNDTYHVDNAGDSVVEADDAGTDQVFSAVSFDLSGQQVEALTLTGSAAVNATGNELANTLTGNAVANVILGLSGDDTLYGAGGNDRLEGGSGQDAMYGGTGNDTYQVGNNADSVHENAGGGIDLVEATITYTLAANVETLTLVGTAAINGTGNGLNNTLTGNSANNVLDGGTGADVMKGGAGNDTYHVDNAGDAAIEANNGGTDQVFSTVSFSLAGQYIEALTLTGTSAINGTGNTLDNIIGGNAGSNILKGGAGDDTLSGGGGSDTLTGGTGNDTFLFDQPLVAGVVTSITDVAPGADKVALSLSIFTQAGGVGPLAAAAFFAGTSAHDASDRIIYNATTGALLYDADGTGAGAATTFATLTPGLALSASDFKVV